MLKNRSVILASTGLGQQLAILGWDATKEVVDINNEIEIHYKGIHKHYIMAWVGIKKILSEEKPHIKEAYLNTLSKKH
ncbi:hypothetical protein [Serratia plymuthica]